MVSSFVHFGLTYLSLSLYSLYIDTLSEQPLSFWKDNQHRFPAITALAQDILAIPATGAGVERLFNTARDVCHYRRGRLKTDTIEELMMFRCTTRFDLQEEENALMKEFFTAEEIEASKEEEREETSDQTDLFELDPISSDEEDAPQEDQEEPEEVHQIADDDDDLPEMGSTQARRPSRNKKRPRDDDDQWEHY